MCAGHRAGKAIQMYLLKLMLEEINIFVKLLDKYKKFAEDYIF